MAVGIVDIDGTLTSSGDEPNSALIAHLQDIASNDGVDIIIVSGRLESRMEETRAWLNEHDVPHARIYLNDFADSTAPDIVLEFKAFKFGKLKEEFGDALEFVVDDDEEVRAAARDLDIESYSPSDFLAQHVEVRATYRGEEIDLMPTRGMRAAADQALAWRDEFNRGGTAVGVNTARRILSGDELSRDLVVKMASYFARHEVDKQADGWSAGEDGFPSAGRIAWDLWGGDAGQTWSTRKRDALMKIDEQVESRSMKRSAIACEYKTIDSGPVGRFSGYGAVFGNVDAYNERIIPGAFAATLDESQKSGKMPAMLWQHNPSQPIGIWRMMREDARGLYVEGELADTQLAREAYSLMKLGALSGLSIGFSVKDERINKDDGARELLAVNLWEVSPVTFPANGAARVEAVKYTAPVRTVREFEGFLRDAGGFSARESKIIAARGFKALRDEVAADDSDLEWINAIAARLTA